MNFQKFGDSFSEAVAAAAIAQATEAMSLAAGSPSLIATPLPQSSPEDNSAATNVISLKGEQVKPFDINEGADGVLLPNLPEAAFIRDVSTYANAFERLVQLDGNAHEAAAKSLGISLGDNKIAKAGPLPPSAFTYGRLSYMPDAAVNGGVLQWPGISPDSLSKVVRENIAPQLIVGMRCDDILRYSNWSDQIWKPGWRIEPKDKTEELSKGVQKDIQEAVRFLENGNIDTGYSEARTRDQKYLTGFQRFLSAGTRDSLTFDAIALWTDMSNDDKVKAFTLLPAGNIRLTVKEGYNGNPKNFAVAVDDGGRIIQAFTRDELTFYVRNPRTDPEIAGYGLSEIELTMRLIKGLQNAIDLNNAIFDRCYSADTEVLTESGWKLFGETDITQDKFATLNLRTGELEYQIATDKVWHDYVGEMYALKSNTFDFLVTPNHRIITQYRPEFITAGSVDYEITTAKELHKKFQGLKKMSRCNYCAPTVSWWEGVEIGEQVFEFGRPYDHTARAMSGDDYCAFMGMYLSEGSTVTGNTNNSININVHQKRTSKGFEPFKVLLAKILGHEAGYYSEERFCFGWNGLGHHVRKFGRTCYEKRIPPTILNATPRQQRIFWDYYMLGDGCFDPSGGIERITTTSRVMADQLQELAQKMGYSASVYTTDAAKYIVPGRVINGARHAIKTSQTRYDVKLKTTKMQCFDLEKTTYSGKIGCVSVPNGTLLVRRKGRIMWSGNSSTPNGILTISGGSMTPRQLDLINRLFTNMKKGITKAWALPVMALQGDAKLELLDLSSVTGNEAYFKEWINMLFGMFCTVYRFPVRRLGYRISGGHRDAEPLTDDTAVRVDEEDAGLAPLLGHWETLINEYLLWSRWPHLVFKFTGKNPAEAGREYEARSLARTWGERRKEVMLEPLKKEAPSELSWFAELMEMAPIEPNLASTFSTLAALIVKAKVGDPSMGGGREDEKKGNEMTSSKDPAASQAHGKTPGIRRDSAAERANAKPS